MNEFTTINNRAYQEQLELRYNCYLTSKIANATTFLIILLVCFINYLRVIGG